MEFAAILDVIQKRQDRSRGIGIASDFVRTIFQCTDGKCGVHPRDIASDDDWNKCIKAASKQLVYSDDDMEITEVFGGSIQPKRSKKFTPTEGASIDYVTVLTTTSKDRDGDILETSGAEPDLKMPALYQHVPFQPVGKLVEIGKHTRNRLEGHFAVLGNAFGNDLALMIKFGMLRTSIGFMPLKWERLKPGEGEEEWQAGFHMLRFKILEDSLVSVPSQEDSIITQHSRGKFASPLVKLHAQSLWDKRPETVASGYEPSPEGVTVPVKVLVTVETKTAEVETESEAETKPCGCKNKQTETETLAPAPAPKQETANEVAVKLCGMLNRGEHIHPDLAAALSESLEQEKSHAQAEALSALVA